MKYNVDLERECDLAQMSIAMSEMNSVLSLIGLNRDDDVEFYRCLAYANQLQEGLRKMEFALKKKLIAEKRFNEEQIDYLTSILIAEKRFNEEHYPSYAKDSNYKIQNIIDKLWSKKG